MHALLLLLSCLATRSGEAVDPGDAVLVEVVVHQRPLVDPSGFRDPCAPVPWLAGL